MDNTYMLFHKQTQTADEVTSTKPDMVEDSEPEEDPSPS